MSRWEDGVAGVNIPMQEYVHRVVMGMPVVVPGERPDGCSCGAGAAGLRG